MQLLNLPLFSELEDAEIVLIEGLPSWIKPTRGWEDIPV